MDNLELHNDVILTAVIESKKHGLVTPELEKIILIIINRVVDKPMFNYLTYREYMKTYAYGRVCAQILNFDPSCNVNVFAYLIQLTLGACQYYIAKQRTNQNTGIPLGSST